MSYTKAELEMFRTTEQIIQAEFDNLDDNQKKALAGLLSQPIEPIAQAIKTPKCYDRLKQFLEHSPLEIIKKLTQLAISLAVLEHPTIASELRDLVIASRHVLCLSFKDHGLIKLNLKQVQALAYAIKAVPHLSTLDLSINCLDEWCPEQVKAFADVIKAAPKLLTLYLSLDGFDQWSLEQIQSFANAIKTVPHLSVLNLSLDGLSGWSLEQVKVLADAIKTAHHLSTLNFNGNDFSQWSLAQIQALADAIKTAPHLSTLNFNGNDFSQWSLTQIQALADAIKTALHLSTLNFSGNGLDQWSLEKVQALADAIRDNFILCCEEISDIPEAIQSLLDRNNRIQTHIQAWEAFFHTPMTQSTLEQMTDIHAQILEVEHLLTAANSLSANHCLSRLATIRSDAFNYSFSQGQSFIDCYGWLLDSHYHWVPLNEHQQKIVDAVLLKAVGSDLAINDTLSPEQRLTLLKYLFLTLQEANGPTSSSYSPNFYPPAPYQPISDGKLKGICMHSILEKSDAINEQFKELPKEYKNLVLQELFETIITNIPAQEAVEQSHQQTYPKS